MFGALARARGRVTSRGLGFDGLRRAFHDIVIVQGFDGDLVNFRPTKTFEAVAGSGRPVRA